MNAKVKKAEAKAKKEKSESVQADKDLKLAREEAKNKKYVALRTLFTSKSKVEKGEEFTCNEKELAIFKKAKAI